jgi:hypothetical protein
MQSLLKELSDDKEDFRAMICWTLDGLRTCHRRANEDKHQGQCND